MRILWEEPMAKGEWQSAHEWLKEYNEREARELDRLRFIEWLMEQEFAPAEGGS